MMFGNFKVLALCLTAICADAAHIQEKYEHKISHPLPKTYKEGSAISFVSSGSESSGAHSLASYSQSGGSEPSKEEDKKDYYAEPIYKYKYNVNDPHTGDKKLQEEHRDGEHTKGQYSLVEPDGSILTVEYSVIGKSGFNAKVHRTEHSKNHL